MTGGGELPTAATPARWQPAVALVPLATLDSTLPAVLYLTAFGLGTAVSMALYAMLAGWAAGRGLARAAGLGSVALGVVWLVG